MADGKDGVKVTEASLNKGFEPHPKSLPALAGRNLIDGSMTFPAGGEGGTQYRMGFMATIVEMAQR